MRRLTPRQERKCRRGGQHPPRHVAFLPCPRSAMHSGIALGRLRRPEVQGHTVDAVAEAGRRRAVLEHVALVSTAPGAVDLGPDHEQAIVLRGADRALDRRPEARPAGAAVELRLRREQRVGRSRRRHRCRRAFHCPAGSSTPARCRARAARCTARV